MKTRHDVKVPPVRGALISTLFLSVVGLSMAACIAQSDGTQASEAPSAATSEAVVSDGIRPLVVTCTSDCSATRGAPITKTGCTTCSATNSSVTCNGVVTECAAAATCVEGPKPVGGAASAGYFLGCGCPDPSDPYPRGWKCRTLRMT